MTADELRAACATAGLPGADIDWRSEESWAVMAAGFTLCGADAHPLHRYQLLKRDALGTYAVMSWDRPESALAEMRAWVQRRFEELGRQLAEMRAWVQRRFEELEQQLAEMRAWVQRRFEELGRQIKEARRALGREG